MGISLIALLIAALTYIREVDGGVSQKRRFTGGERHACVESDSAERKEKRALRLERTATIFPFDLRGARTSAAGTHGVLVARIPARLPFYVESSVPEYLPMLIYLSVTRRDPPIPPRLDRVACFSVRGSKQHRRSTFISYVREDETRRRVGC